MKDSTKERLIGAGLITWAGIKMVGAIAGAAAMGATGAKTGNNMLKSYSIKQTVDSAKKHFAEANKLDD